MDKKGVVILLFAVLLLALPAAFAGSMTLLAVSKTNTGLVGTDAGLELDIKEGSGRVFISTFPLTNVDTQISFRMAKEFACDFLDRDCAKYDFYYVIRSKAPIIGGPSAGAAATTLTIAELDKLKLDAKAAATGTINSGGIVGPVAGIKQKIEAAARVGLKKVLIPEGTRYYSESEEAGTAGNSSLLANDTIDLVEYGRELGVEVKEVAVINDMVYELTGKRYKTFDENVEISPVYAKLMENISIDLCDRSSQLRSLIDASKFKDKDDLEAAMGSAFNLTKTAALLYRDGMYYSSASYCYGANVKYRYLSLLQENLSAKDLSMLINATEVDVKALKLTLDEYSYTTINDLQTYLVVGERLSDATEFIRLARAGLNGSLDSVTYSVSLAIERQYSAYYWSKFFGTGGKSFKIEKESLGQFCQDKMSEANERIQYIQSIVPIDLSNLRDELDVANSEYMNGSYEDCIFTASKVKARTNLLLGAVGLKENGLDSMISKKIDIAKQAIIKETKRGVFPILGYSYYEYAKSLRKDDPNSALLYAELSLELSSFDMYFEPTNGSKLSHITIPWYMYFIGGIIMGYGVALAIVLITRKKGQPRREKVPISIRRGDKIIRITIERTKPPR
jgi:uncharacterized protein